MGHDATKVQLGSSESSFKIVDAIAGNIEAGLAVVQKSDGTVSTTLSDGALIGVSFGADLSGTGKFMALCRKGDKIPLQLGSAFTPVIGAQVQIHATSGQGVASGTPVNATYQSANLTGIKEDGITTVPAALISMPGGL